MSYQQTGQIAEINSTEIVLGPDLLGRDIPLRDRMRPLFAIFLLMMESCFIMTYLLAAKNG